MNNRQLFDSDDIGCLDSHLNPIECDSLAVILLSYFQTHCQRPECDESTEGDDNGHWGDWVVKQAERTQQEYADELNRLAQERSPMNSLPAIADALFDYLEINKKVPK